MKKSLWLAAIAFVASVVVMGCGSGDSGRASTIEPSGEVAPTGCSAACGKGQWCKGSACVACDDATHCGSECLRCNGKTPLCVEGACVECGRNSDCAAGNWCDQGACAPCAADDPDHCGETCAVCTGTSAPQCVAGACVACGSDADCPETKPHCDATGACKGCLQSSDCDSGKWCDAGSCVTCGDSDPDHCGGTCSVCTGTASPVCAAGQCGQCALDEDCGAGKWCDDRACALCSDDDDDHCGAQCARCNGTSLPHCHHGACAACGEDADCGAGSWCNGGACEPCTDSDDAHCGPSCAACAGATSKCSAGACAQCAKDGDCPGGSRCDQGTCSVCANDDPDHCGSSCARCTDTASPRCLDGACGQCVSHGDCSADRPYCVGHMCVQCVQDTHCPTGQWCSAGACVGCSDDDPAHCGGACARCTGTASPSCVAGKCAFCEFDTQCAVGKWCKAGECTSCTSDDARHCGATCARCEGTSLPWCTSGVCAQCDADSKCGDGRWCSSGVCTGCSNDDAKHCGAACAVCSGSTPACAGGSCECVRTSPTSDTCYATGKYCDGGSCQPCTQSDNDHCGNGTSQCVQCTGTASPWCVSGACKQCRPGTDDCGAGKWCDGGACKACSCTGGTPVCSLANGSCSCNATSCANGSWCDAGACKTCSCPATEPVCDKGTGACACTSSSCGSGTWCDGADCQACQCATATPACTNGTDCKCTATSCGTGARCLGAGSCEDCTTTAACGPTCVACSGKTPVCAGKGAGCVCQPKTSVLPDSCGGGSWCDDADGTCKGCAANDPDHCGGSCAKCTGTATPICVNGACKQCGASQDCPESAPWCVNNQCQAAIVPTYPVPPSGQERCYDDVQSLAKCPTGNQAFFGQDAQYPDRVRTLTSRELARVSVPDGQDVTYGYADSLTGLTWLTHTDRCRGNPPTCTPQSLSASGLSWQQSADYCANLTYNGGGWRLPSVYELRSIALYEGAVAYVPEMPTALTGDRYWTATMSGQSTADEWCVDFTRGSSGICYRTEQLHAACVKGAPWVPNDLSRYQDAEYKSAEKVLVDLATMLIWATQAQSGGTWQEALAYCEALDYGSFTNWRLPGVNELGSLVKTGGAAATEASNIQKRQYWTSTSSAATPSNAWTVEFAQGIVDVDAKSATRGIVCVRGRP